MLSFTKGKPIAIVKGGKDDKKIIKIYNDNYRDEGIKKWTIPLDEKGKLFPLPQKESERIYVSAPSGAGKSTFIGQYIKQLRKGTKGQNRRPFILFSRVEEDTPLDNQKPIRIPLTREEFDEEPLECEEFENCIVVFDDIDTMKDKALLKYIQNFRDDLLECGRHYGITTISTTHCILNFHTTRTLLNEAMSMVIFPRACGSFQLKNYLERYMGFDKKEIDIIKKLPTRWLFIQKTFPRYMIWEKGVQVI